MVISAGIIAYAIVFVLWVFYGGSMEIGLDAQEVGATRGEVRDFAPRLMHYIDHLHVALGGFMLGLGVATGGLAWFGLREGRAWALWVIVAAAGLALVVSTPMHHLHGFDTWVHIAPVYPGVALAALATWLATRGLRDGKSTENDRKG